MAYLDTSMGSGRDLRFADKLKAMDWTFLLLVILIACIGFAMLFSVANGSLNPWASRQMVRFAIGLVIFFIVAFTDIRVWMDMAYPFYFAVLVLLIAVDFVGVTGMGAQRWLKLGPIQIQPSEIMKIAVVMALARYFHGITLDQVSRPLFLIPVFAMIGIPMVIVLRQPDLGTAALLGATGVALLFLAGLKFRIIFTSLFLAIPAGYVAWTYVLLDYQKERIFTFLDPSRDPLGAGYNIIQSIIALGSGGLFGKGYMQGSQAQLDFLPEKQTDFIFTMLGEEFGLVGGAFLLGLYVVVLGYGIAYALQSKNHFGRLLAMGICVNFFLYLFINAAMVMGLLPVVGVPLPLVSYGGTAMMTLMFGFGLLMSVHIHKNTDAPRSTVSLW